MTGLISDILRISRLESMDAEVMFSDVRISVLLQEIMDSLKPLAASCQVFLHVDCKPLCIRANLQQMKELFTNPGHQCHQVQPARRPGVDYGG